MDDNTLPAPRRWPLIVAIIGTVLWLGLTAVTAAVALRGSSLSEALGFDPQPLAAMAGLVLGMAAPLAVLWLAAALLRERSAVRAESAVLLARALDMSDARLIEARGSVAVLDAAVESLGARLAATGEMLAGQSAAIDAAGEAWTRNAARLTAASESAAAAGVSLGSATPAALADAEKIAALLRQSQADGERHLAEAAAGVTALQAALTAAGDAAQQNATGLAGSITSLTDTSARTLESLQVPAQRLTSAVDAAFTRTAKAMDSTRDSVHAQTSALLASVEQASVTLDQIGGEAARQIGRRLEILTAAATDFGKQLEAQQARSAELIDNVERGFVMLDTRLDRSITAGNAALESMATRMTGARDAIAGFAEPAAAHSAALDTVEARTVALSSAAGKLVDVLGSALTAAVPQLSTMNTEIETLHARADALSTPLAAGHDAIAGADTRLAATSAALAGMASTLAAELEAARSAIAEIESRTEGAGLAASTQLLDVFARVREIAGQTSGVMRDTLARVIDEAMAALEDAGSRHAETAFATPVRAHIAEVEAASARAAAAGQAAAERLSGRLVALAGTVAGVEEHIEAIDVRHDLRQRDDIVQRSAALLDSLQGTAVDTAKLLAVDVTDNDWAAFLKGDGSRFARRTVRAIDNGTARAIGRQFETDENFRQNATRYIDEFDTLLKRAGADRAGNTLVVTLLSSDVGKLYAALKQSTENLR